MPSDRALAALHAIRDNIGFARDFPGSASISALKADRLTFYAISRCLEIVSEAAQRLPAEIRERHPDQPWRMIMGLGNIYRHDYDNVVEAIAWRTVHENFPSLDAAIETEIARLGQDTATNG